MLVPTVMKTVSPSEARYSGDSILASDFSCRPENSATAGPVQTWNPCDSRNATSSRIRVSLPRGPSVTSSSSLKVILYGLSLYSDESWSAVGNHSCVKGTAAGEHKDLHFKVPVRKVLGKT